MSYDLAVPLPSIYLREIQSPPPFSYSLQHWYMNQLLGAQPQMINVQHKPYTEGSGTIEEEGQKIIRVKGTGICFNTMLPIYYREAASIKLNNMVA